MVLVFLSCLGMNFRFNTKRLLLLTFKLLVEVNICFTMKNLYYLVLVFSSKVLVDNL